jgi:hypothetical protein
MKLGIPDQRHKIISIVRHEDQGFSEHFGKELRILKPPPATMRDMICFVPILMGQDAEPWRETLVDQKTHRATTVGACRCPTVSAPAATGPVWGDRAGGASRRT